MQHFKSELLFTHTPDSQRANGTRRQVQRGADTLPGATCTLAGMVGACEENKPTDTREDGKPYTRPFPRLVSIAHVQFSTWPHPTKPPRDAAEHYHSQRMAGLNVNRTNALCPLQLVLRAACLCERNGAPDSEVPKMSQQAAGRQLLALRPHPRRHLPGANQSRPLAATIVPHTESCSSLECSSAMQRAVASLTSSRPLSRCPRRRPILLIIVPVPQCIRHPTAIDHRNRRRPCRSTSTTPVLLRPTLY